MSLEDLERKLSRTSRAKSGRKKKAPVLKQQEPEERTAIPEPRKRMKTGVIVGVVVVCILAAAAGVAGMVLWRLSNSANAIELETAIPDEIYRGIPFDMTVQVANNTNSLLQNAAIAITTPEGITVLSTFAGRGSIAEETIGDLGTGSLAKKTFSLIATGEPGTDIPVSVSVDYNLGNSRFEREQKQNVRIAKSPIVLSIAKPDHIVQGSEFEITIEYENQSQFDFQDVVLETQYPASFLFRKASLTPDSLNTMWRLGAVNSGSKGSISITGVLDGVGETQADFGVTISAVFLGKPYPVAEGRSGLTLAPSPIGLGITVNKNPNYVARIGDRLVYTIRYENQSGIALADMVLRADVIGELVDSSSLQTEGLIDPVTHQAIWNANRIPGLRLVEPGASGEVDLEVRLKSTFPIQRAGDKNFSVELQVRVESPSVPYYLSASKTSAAAAVKTKVSGLIFLDARTFHRDAESGIANSGTVPPRVGVPTQYTVHWIVRNYATDVKTAVAEATLEEGVRWTGVVKSSGESVPLFDEDTKTVSWTIDSIPATQGVISDPLEAIFQIELVPSGIWIGQSAPLVGAAKLKATDLFTGLELVSGDLAVTTAVPDDVTVGQSGGKVIP